MDVFNLFFHWPDGGVWSNLIASAICFALSTTLTIWKLHTNHKKHMAKLDAIHEHIKANSNVA